MLFDSCVTGGICFYMVGLMEWCFIFFKGVLIFDIYSLLAEMFLFLITDLILFFYVKQMSCEAYPAFMPSPKLENMYMAVIAKALLNVL
jgi:hypothetical protein